MAFYYFNNLTFFNGYIQYNTYILLKCMLEDLIHTIHFSLENVLLYLMYF